MKIACHVISSPLSAARAKRANRHEFVGIVFSSERGRGPTCGTSPKVPPKKPLASDLERSPRTRRDIADLRNGRAFSLGDSEKATAEEDSPHIEDLHLPRHPTSRSSLFSSRTRFFPVRTLLPFPPLPPFSVGLSIYLGHLHPRYLTSRPRRRLLIRGFTESKTLNAASQPCRS